ncbi:hypothetical protein RhiLY_11667 [Ceratobasidium sp. AG-Ba]|nr:hypothetical protein RhiLY_11667 [Ceratobasidium sp. AG-Ba]
MSSYSYAASSYSSTASLVPQQQRDYSNAFATLASSYGTSGAAPCRQSSKTATHLATSSEPSSKRLRSLFSRRSNSSASSPDTTTQQPEKYVIPRSQDFGALMDKYGASMPLGGQTPF